MLLSLFFGLFCSGADAISERKRTLWVKLVMSLTVDEIMPEGLDETERSFIGKIWDRVQADDFNGEVISNIIEQHGLSKHRASELFGIIGSNMRGQHDNLMNLHDGVIKIARSRDAFKALREEENLSHCLAFLGKDYPQLVKAAYPESLKFPEGMEPPGGSRRFRSTP